VNNPWETRYAGRVARSSTRRKSSRSTPKKSIRIERAHQFLFFPFYIREKNIVAYKGDIMAEKFICDECNFSSSSEDHEKLISEVQEHAKREHGVRVTREEVEEALEEV
jgi:predicted small metal-binding protein